VAAVNETANELPRLDGLWVWGIDLSTKAVDLVVDEQGRYIDNSASFQRSKVEEKLRGAERLAHQLERTESFVKAIVGHFFLTPPGLSCPPSATLRRG
jgi:hypothetical protein